jgi:hypothetical protein
MFCRQTPALVQVGRTFHALLWHLKNILDFSIRRRYFKSELKKRQTSCVDDLAAPVWPALPDY